jgi:DNA polymerase-3 subunit alpha
MRFAGYFLIVWDFIRHSRDNCIPVGPGRGSAAGSLVAYSLHITDVDPLQNELLFERFLNPERVSFPDIDIDFCQRRRGEVIEYVTKKVRARKRQPDHYVWDDGGQSRHPRRRPRPRHALCGS